MTSEPSQPPSLAYSAIEISVSFSGSFSSRFQELHVPGRVVEAGPLPVDLVGEAAGADDGDLKINRVALDRLAQRRDRA